MFYSYARGIALNFNVYLDAQSVDRLNALARKRGTNRNALIREAVARLLEHPSEPAWPAEVLRFRGEPGAPPFESSRRTLRVPRKAPLR